MSRGQTSVVLSILVFVVGIVLGAMSVQAAQIPGCVGDTMPAVPGYPADFVDVSPALPDRQIWDSGKHPGTYTLTVTDATNGSDAAAARFIATTDPDSVGIYYDWIVGAADDNDPILVAHRSRVSPSDPSPPFTATWPFGAAGMFTMDNLPYNHSQAWYFAAVASDASGNYAPEASLCVFEATVIDGTAPTVCLAQVGDDRDLRDGAMVWPDSAINVFVYTQDPPLPGRFEDNDLPEWVAGADGMPGIAGVDDDGDGTTDETDFGWDAIAGNDDDEWNGSSASGNLGETDDYRTNDIVTLVFQANPVGDEPDLGWSTFATVQGDTSSSAGQVVDWTEPVRATWNTWGLPTGDYDLRTYGVDWEGNSSEPTACIMTVGVRSNPLRAYIQPEVCTGGTGVDLYAVHSIAEYEIDQVRFEYTLANTAGCDSIPGDWQLLSVDDAATPGDPRGDAVLYPPVNRIPDHDPIQNLVGRSFAETEYRFYDADGDGYGSRDPVVLDASPGGNKTAGDREFHQAEDAVLIGGSTMIPEGAPLADFAVDEFWAEADGETDGLDSSDWIFLDNRMNHADRPKVEGDHELNRWSVSWDTVGLPDGKYLVRAIAIAENNVTDVISYQCYDVSQQNPPEIEMVRVDTALPNADLTTLTLPDASTIDLSAIVVPPYIGGNTKWIRIEAEGGGDIARALFEYSRDGGVSWQAIDVNNDDDFYTDINGMPGFQAGEDEVFNDLNGNFVYDAGDVFRTSVEGAVPTTPPGWPLLPLIGEDDSEGPGNAGVDNDQDGQIDEDPPLERVVVDPSRAGNPEDYSSPFYVYLNIGEPARLSDENVLLRATAYDVVCGDAYRADPTPNVVAVILGENQAPEAEVFRVEDLDGNEIDTRPPIMDGNGVATIGADSDTMRVFATAEDMSSIASVDLFYRLDPRCYQTVPEGELQRSTDLALVVDGSASMDPAAWSLQKEGVAVALESPGIVPADGTVSFTLVQFGNGAAVIEIPLTLITSSSVATTLGAAVRGMAQRLDGTPTAAGVDAAVAAIGAGTPGARQVIIIATDGPPTWPAQDPVSAAMQAVDRAEAAGIDEIDALGVGGEVDIAFLAQLVRHGQAEPVPDFANFGAAVGRAIRRVIFNSLAEMRQWRSMSLAGLTRVDGTYPYDFNVVTDRIADGVYQFYPRAYDANGTYNDAPVNPWGFKKAELKGIDFAFVSTPDGNRWSAPDTAAVGDEYFIHAGLIDPSQAPATAVRFYFAPRKLDTPVDPAAVQPAEPFTAQLVPAEPGILGWETGDAVTLRIKCPLGDSLVVDSVATYTRDLAALGRTPTKYDFTLAAANVIRFGERPAATDTILVSYNFGAWTEIAEGDSWSPYTVAWSQPEGGIPDVDGAEAYDLIAVAKFDLNGDGVYDSDPDACDFIEARAGEGNYLILRDESRPNVVLYGLAYSDAALFVYPDRNWPGNPLFRSGDELGDPNYENRLSGVETDVFVDASDSRSDVASVNLDITATDPVTGITSTVSVDMGQIRSGTTIDLPITFYEDDYSQWAPGAIENVILQISLDGGVTWNADTEMTRTAATRSWSVDGRFNIGIADGSTQRYRFTVNPVGDEQAVVVMDARNFIDPPTVPGPGDAYSALNVPGAPFWYTHLDSATQLRTGSLHRVIVKATDTFGNTGTNLTSAMPGGSSAQGPIVFILDQDPPKVNSITALSANNEPLTVTRVSPNVHYNLMATVSESPFPNVSAVRSVVYQHCPNFYLSESRRTWVTIGEGSAWNGTWGASWTPTSPLADGYDNDGDGLSDEPDEAVAPVTIRAIAVDDAMNAGYSDRQDPPVVLALTVDSAEPSAALTEPADGEIFGYGSPILLSGTAIGDSIPGIATTDVDLVRFQARIDRFFYLDETAEGSGLAGVYDNGVDEIWSDVDDDGLLSQADSCLYPGQDGQCRDVQASDPANFWFDLDPTPQNNSDAPWLNSANNGELWEMTWVPSASGFIHGLYGDRYVRLRMLSRDTAGNWDTVADLLPPLETMIVLADSTVTRAYLTHFVTHDAQGAVDPSETKPIAGIASTMVYGVLQAPGQEEVVRADIYCVSQPDGSAPDTVLAATTASFAEGAFSAVWDASALPEAEYLLFATALDFDGNEGSKREATKVRVRIDRTPPMVNYTPTGSYAGFTAAVPYIDDGIANHNSMVILPSPYTQDVAFTVTTPSDATHPFDVASVVLEWRYPGDPAGSWRPAGDFFAPANDPNGTFAYEPSQDFVVEGVTHHVWWLHLEDFANESRLLQTGRMEFRALATDQAGNTNALQTDVAAYTADNTAGTGVDWTDDSPSDTLQTGDTIAFEITVRDSWLADSTRTDITQVALVVREKRSPTPAWPSPYATLAPDSSQIDTGDAIWIARFTWTAPILVMHDTAYEFGVVLTDAAGNTNIVPWQSPDYLVTVEDTAAPARTKIIDVVGLTQEAAEVGGNPENPDVWMDMSTIPAQMTTFQPGTDWLISVGGSLTPPPDGTQGTAVGDACATVPRNVGEGYLNDTSVPRTVRVAREVTIVGRTQSGDDAIRWVTFLLAPCDANGVLSAPSEWITLGRDEYPPGFPLYYWHLVVNTTLYVDGTYKLAAYAQDVSGNVEDINSLDWTSAIIVIDSEGPSAQMDANPGTEVVENTATVERNLPFTLFARTLVPGTATPQNYESDTVEFFYKRGQDLNVPQSWVSVPDPNLPGEDGNPDETRPYSLDVNVGSLWEPSGGETHVPLSVGETYDFVTQVSDEVCNATTYLETYDDSLVTGVGRRYIRLLIQDTIAPHFVFTSAVRRGGDETVIESPTTIHARGFQEITASVMTGDLDTDHVEFVHRVKETTTWIAIDADVTSADNRRTWVLGEWDLQTLQPNTWYEVACIGVDDVGNTDGNPGIIEVYVDMAEPSAALSQPMDGEVFGYSAQILLSGTAIGDYLPEKTIDEVDLVRFQAGIDGYFYLDETAGDLGHADSYDNGLDEVWFDRDGDRLLSQADSCVYPGADGSCFSFPQNPGGNKSELPPAQFWFDLDPTPQDNGDDPWLTEANNGELWEVTWLPSGLSFISVCGLGDKYVRLRMLSRDTAGNWDTEADLRGPKETIVILSSDPSATSDRPTIGGPAILWARPNPSRGLVEIACGLSRVGGLPELEIYDPAGRLVRRLLGTPREGVLRATWDGMTESGSRVGSGVYFVRLKSGAKGSEQRLLILR